ncbi:MAG: hypothetical protein KJ737_07250 [Proteobacteria bacterium]|nr:hypothetical protein [Pseudomonadota bacterium]
MNSGNPTTYTVYFQIAGISVEVTSDLPVTPSTFGKKFESFRVETPGADLVKIHHHFSPPDVTKYQLNDEVYRKAPWVIFKEDGKWIYGEVLPGKDRLNRMAVFSEDHASCDMYHDSITKRNYVAGNLASLTLFPTDQIIFSKILPERQGCYIHSAGLIIDGKGYVFVGHSDAGKSTLTNLLRKDAEILCDDRNIIRKQGQKFLVHGTWSHGDIEDVSSACAEIQGIMFIHQADTNRIVPVESRQEAMKRILPCLIKPFVTADWWYHVLDLVEDIVKQVPCYDLYFDKSGKIVDWLIG